MTTTAAALENVAEAIADLYRDHVGTHGGLDVAAETAADLLLEVPLPLATANQDRRQAIAYAREHLADDGTWSTDLVDGYLADVADRCAL